MKLKVYRNMLKFGLLQVANYRGEIWFGILGKVVILLGVMLLWWIIGQDSEVSIGVDHLIPYFLIASSVSGLVDGESLRFSQTINDEIKSGTLSSHLLRPVHPVIFLYVSFLGRWGVVLVTGTLLLIAGLLFLPAISLINVVLMVMAIFLAFFISLSFNLLIGTISFWTTEAGHLQNVASHVIRVFGGILIPIPFFPEKLKLITLLLPFPALGFLPASLAQANGLSRDIWISFLASSVWVLILLPLSLLFWKKGLRRYEAVGI